MLSQILVPLDGSPLSEQSLTTAIEIAHLAGAKLRLARVHSALPATVDGTDLHWLDEQIRSDASHYLVSVATRLRTESSIEVVTEMLEGPTARSICDAAARSGADLIVMSTHGRGGLSRLWLGSVAEGVARHATIPVLLLKPQSTSGPPQVQPLTRILIPLDGSDAGESVIPPAMSLGRLFGAQFVLIRVLFPMMIASSVSPFGEVTYQEDSEQMQLRVTSVEHYLRTVAARMREADKNIRVDTFACVDRSAGGAILREAASVGANLIALTTHTGGMARSLFGSVADKVLRGSDAPVLIYRPPVA